MIYGITTWNHIGDSIISAGAVHNVKAARPDLLFTYVGWGRDMWRNNPDIVWDARPDRTLPVLCYGSRHDEQHASRGNLVEGFTLTLCNHLGIPPVPVVSRVPYAVLTEEEIEASRKWRGCWLFNANCQTTSRSKGYPHWQRVVDLLAGRVRLVQVGSTERRNFTEELHGVEDMRGKSQDLRQYMSMIYGCDGILSPPSGIVNIGAAFGKQAVVVVGARELGRLSGYPNMDFISTVCCGHGISSGCIAFTFDGKGPCTNSVWHDGKQYSACMDMVEPERIAEAVLCRSSRKSTS